MGASVRMSSVRRRFGPGASLIGEERVEVEEGGSGESSEEGGVEEGVIRESVGMFLLMSWMSQGFGEGLMASSVMVEGWSTSIVAICWVDMIWGLGRKWVVIIAYRKVVQ